MARERERERERERAKDDGPVNVACRSNLSLSLSVRHHSNVRSNKLFNYWHRGRLGHCSSCVWKDTLYSMCIHNYCPNRQINWTIARLSLEEACPGCALNDGERERVRQRRNANTNNKQLHQQFSRAQASKSQLVFLGKHGVKVLQLYTKVQVWTNWFSLLSSPHRVHMLAIHNNKSNE